jgi:hypothetical protein
VSTLANMDVRYSSLPSRTASQHGERSAEEAEASSRIRWGIFSFSLRPSFSPLSVIQHIRVKLTRGPAYSAVTRNSFLKGDTGNKKK